MILTMGTTTTRNITGVTADIVPTSAQSGNVCSINSIPSTTTISLSYRTHRIRFYLTLIANVPIERLSSPLRSPDMKYIYFDAGNVVETCYSGTPDKCIQRTTL